MWNKFVEMMLDDNKHSFGKTVSLPFLVSAWIIGTIYGVKLLLSNDSGNEVTDLIWTMAGVATVLYASYKAGNVLIQRGRSDKVCLPEEIPPRIVEPDFNEIR